MHMGTSYKLAHRRGGKVIWESDWLHNSLSDQGEIELLATYFRSQAQRTTLYGRLYGAGFIPDDATLAAPVATEVSGSGYAPVSWTVGDTDFAAPVQVGTGTKVGTTTSTTKTFTATGTWTPAVNLVLATSTDNSGKLVASVPLSTTRTLVNTDTLDVSVAVGLD